ncbi:MAG: flagellar export chaperone FlgN [Firmicutes bacterium]|nr:flagellar export chaperone FlgN [Bacillota bacterium]
MRAGAARRAAAAELARALEEERDACRRLREGGRKVQAALAAGRTAGVRAALAEQDAALRRLERARRRRREAQELVAGELGLEATSPLGKLLERMPPEEGARLADLRRALEEEVRQVSRVNQETMRLVEAFGRYVDFLRDLVQRHERAGVYTADGRPARSPGSSQARTLSRYR